MSVYFIVQEQIKDEEALVEYRAKAAASNSPGKLLAAEDGVQVIEGDWHGSRVVLIEFEDKAAFRTWYESPAYQEALAIRLGATDSRAALVAGVGHAAAH